MRYVKSRHDDDLSSAASSVRSVDSYEIFASDCSDFEDTEIEERRRRNNKHINQCRHLMMDRLETSPLLGTAPKHGYNHFNEQAQSELTSSKIISSYKRMENSTNQEKRKQSSLVTIFSVWNTIMGSSLLTMAWGVERAGLPAALVLVAVMAALCLYTAHVLLRVNLHHGTVTCEVPALCRTLLGRPAEVVAHAFSLVVLLGANVVYWILITNFLYFTVNYFADLRNSNTTDYNTTLLCPKQDVINGSLIIPMAADDSPFWSLHTTVPIYVALIVFPLLNFKNVTFFTKFNSLGTLSVAYLLIFVVTKGYIWGINISVVTAELQIGKNAAVLSGMLALSFYIHNIIITIMSNNAKQENNGRDLAIAFVLVTLTYTLVGAGFYICFPLAKSCIEDNILNNFEMHDVMTAVARILLLFQVVTVYPLVAYMLRTEAILLLPLTESRCLTVCINIIIVVMCIIVACFCPNIGTIIRYTGAVSGLVHIFTLPSVLQVKSLYLRRKLTWWKIVFYCFIVLFGAVNLLMQFFISE
ncbi:sodium-coupled neutral amino acid transporter 9 homolog isoform X2 [Amyelois transitella]|uniref:sodium-coupled neutral amino acid transporter 9 homolog isoform X2 n=1 Tax=Amyelois transitella TaxID=680683 RepID=UPI00067CC039|nr:sodium-coupled neutral amino acid transporter 9 homolog isoform X2 [Amyelois transitella]